MPFYEYQCQACGHEFEKLQKMSDAVLKDCPSCSKPELKKMISAAAFRLKGNGWYATDFKDSGKKKNESTNAKTPAKDKKTTSSNSDSSGTSGHKH